MFTRIRVAHLYRLIRLRARHETMYPEGPYYTAYTLERACWFSLRTLLRDMARG
jgi:hypothetical protein